MARRLSSKLRREKRDRWEKIEKYYEQIAAKLDEIIPTEWDRIVMYAEETEYFRTVCFYYYTDNYTKVHHSGDIPVEFNVDEDIYDSLISEAN